MSEQAEPVQKKTYDDDHLCPIKEARVAKLKGRPPSPFQKWLNRIMVVFVGIPLILVLGFAGAIAFIDFNQYKPQIEAELQQRLGYEIKVQGAIDVSPFPFSIQVHKIVLKNPSSYTRANLAQIKSVRASLSLWQLLLQRRLELLAVELESPELYLEVLANGEKNWQGLKDRLMHQAQAPTEGFRKVANPVVQSSSPENTLFDWRLESLIAQNSRMEWVDQQALTHWTLNKFDLMAFDLSPNKPFKLLTNFELTSSLMAADSVFHLTGLLTLDETLSEWQLSNWLGNARLKLPITSGVPETRVELSGEQAKFWFKSNQFHVKQAQFNSLDSTMTMSVSGKIEPGALLSEGEIKAKQINLKHWFRHADVDLPDFINPKALSDFSLSLNWQQSSEQLSIDQVSVQLDDSLLTGKIWRQQASNTATPAQLQFDLTLDGLDLETYRAKLPIKVSAQADLKSTKAKGTIQTYLPIGVPVATLKALNAQGHLQLKQLKLWQMQFDTIDMTLMAKQGQLTLAPFDAKLYGGGLRSKLQIDVTGDTPSYKGLVKFEDLELRPFLAAGWQMEQLGGTLNGQFDFVTQGVNGVLLTQNMQGTLTAEIHQGDVKGLDVNKLLAGQATTRADKTAFSKLTSKSHIQKGQLIIDRLNLKSDRFSAIGTGQLAMLKGFFKGKLFTTYHKPPESLETFAGLEIPIIVKGPIDQLIWSVELEKIMNSPKNQQKLFESLKNFLGGSSS